MEEKKTEPNRMLKQQEGKNPELLRKEQLLRERSKKLAETLTTEAVAGTKMDCLEFILSEEHYMISSDHVFEVIPLVDLTMLPCTPAFIVGIVNIRGRILSVFDLKKFLNLPGKGITNLNRVIRVKNMEIEIGLLVDEVVGSVSVKKDELAPAMATLTEAEREYVIGVSQDRSIVLDIEKFLSDEKIIIDEEI